LRDVATSKLASDLSSGSKKPEPASSVPTSEIYSWASQLPYESRELRWILLWHVWPDAVVKSYTVIRAGMRLLIGLPHQDFLDDTDCPTRVVFFAYRGAEFTMEALRSLK
jgi:hypothetical protein